MSNLWLSNKQLIFFLRFEKYLFHLFATFAEFERNLILERSSYGRATARARDQFDGVRKNDGLLLFLFIGTTYLPTSYLHQL